MRCGATARSLPLHSLLPHLLLAPLASFSSSQHGGCSEIRETYCQAKGAVLRMRAKHSDLVEYRTMIEVKGGALEALVIPGPGDAAAIVCHP